MKIALVSPYDVSYPGGVYSHIYGLDHYFNRMGHQVRIIAPASRPVTEFGDRFIRLGTPRPVPSSGSIARVTLSLTLDSKVKTILAEEKFDIIHLHEPMVPMLCTTVLRHANTTCIGTFHAAGEKHTYRGLLPFFKPMMMRWFRRLDGKIAVSQPAVDFASQHFGGNYEVIPNGIDLERFKPDIEPFEEYRDGKFNILFLGRLEKRKGLLYLLKAFKLVRQEVPNVRLIIVGHGTRLRKQYEKMVADEKIGDVIFKGGAEYKDVPRYYKTADIFCVPNTGNESMGYTLIEAMAVGKPIVASNIPGFAAVATDGVEGLLVPPKEEGPLAKALISLLKDETQRKRMAEKALEKSRQYGMERISQRVMEYYIKTILTKTPGKGRL
jgi:phosphatidyl-myo-inositol alpha-mannosyltransferase